ncbi:TonB-dependent siderophore receptor [Aureimonas pseudogalii]|uniref:Iron complex outermembrane receptor protein n=1 Tax=Aureimonas pseudogalii TaxID=1744844 RepID=A0A7W6H342_9HYPH|nr:TonB-dependent siderophore receptor [Aureimonas pseudogalii]MBB3997636.1 iron complex outermembrane receptor protein [Aureimonas pseudogalii]
MSPPRLARTLAVALLSGSCLTAAGLPAAWAQNTGAQNTGAQGTGAQDTVVLDTVTVEGGGGTATPGEGEGSGLETDGYVAKAARVGTKTDTPLQKVPQSISVVSSRQLEDRKVQTLSEALTYTPGVRVGAFGFDPRFDSFSIRGFDVVYNGVYRDGLRELTGNFSIFKTEPYGLQGIAVLKGPSSVLYGGGSPGGIVNLTSKRPTDAPFREIETQVGNNGRVQAQFDASGPLAGNDNVLYRITGLARDADTDLRSVPDDRTFIAPALTLRSDDRNTHLTILGEYADITTGGNATYFSRNGRPSNLESSDPAFGDFDQQQGRVGYEFEHRFDETLTIRQNLRYAHIDADVKYTSIGAISADGLTASRSTGRIVDDLDSIAVDNQAELKFDTGAVAHTLLGGLDYNHVDVDDKIGLGFAPDLNLVTLNYGQQFIASPALDFVDTTTRQSQTGVYLQDQLEYERFVLTLGGRYDWLSQSAFNTLAVTTSEQDDHKFSGRAGLSYLFDNGLAPYVSYSTSFAPVIGNSFSGAAFSPSEGEQEEIGVKYAPSDVNLSVNAALFRITQTNVLASDPNYINFQIQRGEVESRGFELEATTSLAAGLDLTAAYTYLDLEITEGDNAGNTPSGIPAHQFSLWGGYTVQSGAADGLGLGAGLRYLGTSWGDDTNTFRNDSRILIDASLSYDFGKANAKLEGVSAQINAKNFFDKRADSCQGGFCYRDEGRNVIGSLRYRF